jgi:hypothetical protein
MTGLSPEGLRAAAAELLAAASAKRAESQREWARRRLDSEPCPLEGPGGAWRAKHPRIAAEERALRKGRAELLANWKHKHEGTPETHEHASRRNQGALATLYKRGAIDGEQLASAEEIAQVAERIAADVTVKTASLETRVDGSGWRYEALHDEKLRRVRREMAYTEWRQRLPHPAPVLDMLTGDQLGFTIVAKRYRMGNQRTKRLLIDALDLWPQILGAVCKEIDEKDLAAAHRRLAA